MLHLPGIGQSPRTLAGGADFARLERGHAQSPEKAGDGLAALALLEAQAAQPPPNPFVQTFEFEPTSRISVVGQPPREEQIELDDDLRQAFALVPTGDLPDAFLGALDALGRNPELAVQQQPMAQELALPDLGDGALVTIDASR